MLDPVELSVTWQNTSGGPHYSFRDTKWDPDKSTSIKSIQ